MIQPHEVVDRPQGLGGRRPPKYNYRLIISTLETPPGEKPKSVRLEIRKGVTMEGMRSSLQGTLRRMGYVSRTVQDRDDPRYMLVWVVRKI